MTDEDKTSDLIPIGRVAKAVGVEAHTIRFWTATFPEISYKIGKGRRKYYSPDAVKCFERIKSLIHKDGVKIKSIIARGLLSPDKVENGNVIQVNFNKLKSLDSNMQLILHNLSKLNKTIEKL